MTRDQSNRCFRSDTRRLAARTAAIGALCILAAATLVGRQEPYNHPEASPAAPDSRAPTVYRLMEDGTFKRVHPVSGPVISGVVTDPHRLDLENVILMLGNVDGSFEPVSIAPDGSFVTPPLEPGTYLLQLERTPHSVERLSTLVGFTMIDVDTADASGIIVGVRRDTSIRGRFRMESDNPAAEWPTHIAVNAYLALDGMPLGPAVPAEGARAGEFVLRNAFGPRVLRSGYTLASLAPSSRWWESRVILNGVDITNVPTDFSEHENADLEVVFTQHPARVVGTVTDGDGRPAKGAWVMAVPADPSSWQHWATTSTAAQADATGEFSIPLLPGKYRVHAVPETTFPSYDAARKGIFRFPHPELTIVTLDEWGVETVSLTLAATLLPR